jgi:hypothetical protein
MIIIFFIVIVIVMKFIVIVTITTVVVDVSLCTATSRLQAFTVVIQTCCRT